MSRPAEMSKMRIYIDQGDISALMNFFPRLKYIHVKELGAVDEELVSSHTYQLNEKLREYLKKAQGIEENLEFLTTALGYNQNELLPHPEKIEYKAQDLWSLIDSVEAEVNQFRQKIEKFQVDLRNQDIARGTTITNLALLQVLKQFHLTPEVLDKLQHFALLTFSVLTDNADKTEDALFKSEISTFLYKQAFSSDRTICMLLCRATNQEEIKQIIKVFNPEYVEIPRKYIKEDGVDLLLVERDIESIGVQMDELEKEYEIFRTGAIGKYLSLQEVLENIHKFLVIQRQFIYVPPHTAVLDIWTPTSEVQNVTELLTNEFTFKIKFKVKEVKYTDIPYEEGYGKEGKVNVTEEVPTLTKHSRFTAPFITLLRLYGLPRYTEVDPTIFIAITFPLLFGIMFADIGHGIVLVITGIVGMYVLRNRSQGTRDMAVIILYCGIGAIFGGFLAGEFFGARITDVPFLQWATFLNIFHDPLQNIGFVFKFCILIGVVHICLGWAIQAMNYTLSRRKYFAFADSFVKITLLSLGTVLIFVYGFNLTSWLSGAFPPILLVVIPSVALMFMRVLGKVFHLDYLKETSVTSILSESSMQTMETFLSILSNVASYSRLLALMGAHLGLMLVVKVGADGITALVAGAGIIGQIIVGLCLVVGNFMVIVIETFFSFIQNMRLHFYEFFSKFYKGSGVPFKPVTLNHKYSEIMFKSAESHVDIVPQLQTQPVE